MDTTFIYETTTRFSDYDFQEHFKLSALFDFLQEAGSLGATYLGWGKNFLWPKGWGFIVTSYYLQDIITVPSGTKIKVKTWPIKGGKAILERDFSIETETGKVICKAMARCVLYDVTNRKILPASKLPMGEDWLFHEERVCGFNGWKNYSLFDCITPKYTHVVASSEYDHYRHLNNTYYPDCCYNCLSTKEWEGKEIAAFQISYDEQCFEGEKINFYTENTSDNQISILAQKEDGSRVIKAKIILK